MTQEINAIREQILPLLKEAGVLRSALFGSVARGEAGSGSDIDILIELPKDKSMFDLIELEEKIGKKLNKKIDLVTYRSLHHLLRDKILSEQVSIL
ncbi:MAG: nucleotidyltransferase family protein [Candidatus Yanofskybacteria bacterium]|nr:nucleotidyltransferase family protein [Candidatus Yanofskybacteria bacterium]